MQDHSSGSFILSNTVLLGIVVVWMCGVSQKLTWETVQEGSEEKRLGHNLNLISELIPNVIN